MENLPVVGVYTFCNTGSVLVHEIDPWCEWVVASVNGKDPQKYDIVEEPAEDEEIGAELGFRMGEWFVPFSMVERVGREG